MDKIIHKFVMSQSLNDRDMMKLTEGKARLITHPEIGDYKNIDDLLGPHKACIILYVTKILDDNSVYGHWCCVFKAEWRNDTISYFDSYGNKPDNTLSHMSDQAISEYGQEPILSHMLLNCGYRVVYNKAKLQKHEKGNAICGRLCSLRLQFKNIDGNEFAYMMTSYKNLSSDELATLLTSFIK